MSPDSIPVRVVISDSIIVIVLISDSAPVFVVRSDVLLAGAEHGVELTHPAPHLGLAVDPEWVPPLQLTASAQTLADHAAINNSSIY